MSSFTRLTVLTSVLTLIVVVCSIKEVAAQELHTYDLDEYHFKNGEGYEVPGEFVLACGIK